MNETSIMHQIMIALSADGHKVFRANVGKVRLMDGRWFDTGLPKGFSDLFGVRPDGKAFFVECKVPGGKIRPEQRVFIEVMQNQGALAGIAHSVEEAKIIVAGNDKMSM